MSKPGVFALSGESKDFVFGNLPLLKDSLKVTLPLILVLQAFNISARVMGYNWVPLVTVVPGLFVYACYALTWHRNCLVAVDPSNVVNPFRMTKADLKFAGFFIALAGGMMLFVFGLSYLTQIVLPRFGNNVALAGSISSLILMLAVMYALLRLYFILPAQSVGVTLSFRDVMQASRGMAWPLIGANFIFALLFILALTVYMLIVGMLVSVGAGGAEIEPVQFGIVSFVATIPELIASFVFIALCTTALSKAYRWGMENNSVQ